MIIFSLYLKAKTCRIRMGCSRYRFEGFSERESAFSLRSRAIGPSDFFGQRRKVVLRDNDYVWAPVLRSFNKIHEVGVLSYLFYPLFKCFVMLELI